MAYKFIDNSFPDFINPLRSIMLTSAIVPGDLRFLLGPATFSQIPSNVQEVLQQAWTSHTDTLKTNLEKVKVDLIMTQTAKV